jgi:hypothetical protein
VGERDLRSGSAQSTEETEDEEDKPSPVNGEAPGSFDSMSLTRGGSERPPLHCREKAKTARERGRKVSKYRALLEEEEDEDEDEGREAEEELWTGSLDP